MATSSKRPRRVKPPNKIDLSYQKLKVAFADSEDLGLYDAELSQIVLRNGQTWHEEANTLLHELLHAICHCYNTGLKYEQEEKVVFALANGVMELLTRNPSLLKYFMKVWNADRSNPTK